MYSKLPNSSGSTLGYRMGSKVGRTEIEAIIAELETAITEHGKIKLLVHMDHWNGMELVALFEDVNFLLHYLKDISALAIVGDSFWEKWLTGISAAVLSQACQYFDTENIDAGWDWLKTQ